MTKKQLTNKLQQLYDNIVGDKQSLSKDILDLKLSAGDVLVLKLADKYNVNK